MRLTLLLCVVFALGCARRVPPPPPNDRQLIAQAIIAFTAAHPQPQPASLWLTNEEDSECDGRTSPESARGGHALDPLAFEVVQNQLVASRWALVVEGHRHNYARDLKAETHKSVTIKDVGSTTTEDLCLLDEAKKRNVERVLVYQVVGASPGSVLVHFRFSNARTGFVEFASTLLSTAAGVEDRTLQ
ncbi:MAG: hypothetical protein Q8L48_19705 [Archangium sp.]|nr:hypothetical protein [Archangium sp.]